MSLDGKVAVGRLGVMVNGDDAGYLTATTVFADGGLMHSSSGL
jgi:hypothetical protein